MTLQLKVTFEEGEPKEISYFDTNEGLMQLSVEGSTAILNPEWDRLHDRYIKDGFKRRPTTGDVLHAVLELPFIDEIDASRVVAKYEESGQEVTP